MTSFLDRHAALSPSEVRSLTVRMALIFVPLFLLCMVGSIWLIRHSPTSADVGASLTGGGPVIATPSGAEGREITPR